jgi:4'-phosphopantetheinyl transferase
MPIEKIVSENDRSWAVWVITEDEATLTSMLNSSEIPDKLTHANKRLEWIAGRVLVQEMFTRMGLKFHGISKNIYGKPFPNGYPYQMSLSHSFPYVAALIDKTNPAGIDLEQPKEKLLRVAHRVFHPTELLNAGKDVIKHCVYWCAKEALIKVYGKKDLFFSENLLVDPFELGQNGDLRGRILTPTSETIVPLRYLISPNFVMVYSYQPLAI